MIKKMKRRFRLVAVLVIGLVLLFLLFAVNFISYRNNIERTDSILERLVEEQNGIEEHIKKPPIEDFENESFDFLKDDVRPIEKDFRRSFKVVLDSNQALINSDSNFNNILSQENSYDMALLALSQDKDFGFVSEYRYIKVEKTNKVELVFLDYSLEKSATQNLLRTSIIVYFLSILFVWILVTIFIKPVIKPIKESYAKQKQFITDASHELKTPLTVISTNLQLLDNDAKNNEWIKSIDKQISRLRYLANQLVSLARMDETGGKLHKEPFDVSLLINDVVLGFEPAIISSDKTLETDIQDGIVIEGNYDAFETVVSTLFTNVLKYSKENGNVRVVLKKKGNGFRFYLENEVESLEKGSYDKFFERFYRGDDSRNSQTGGFGIGLSIAKAIVEEHRGKIKAYSKDGEYLTIEISI